MSWRWHRDGIVSKSARSPGRKAPDLPNNKPRKATAHSTGEERASQFTLKMRESLHKELARLAFEADMTMRGFIMNALQAQGLSVTEEDLVDRRRR